MVVLALLIPALGIGWYLASRPGLVDTDPWPTPPGTPVPTITPSDYSGINPGWDPSNGSGPFSEPRESRPPVQPPTATPRQEWPDLEGPVTPVTEWTNVDGGTERGSYRIPSSGWTYKDGLMIGFETMQRVIGGNIVSFDREFECQGDYWSAVMLRKAAADQPDLKRFTRLLVMDWAQMRNTEYEGDYYEIPAATVEPFTFADGGEGFIGSVSFVPMYQSKYSCNTPAIRISAVTRTHDGLAYQMLAITHIGDAQSLPLATEREILATFTVGE
ncbi:hypothetical protein BW730_06355 [Tessaracoccus aquimaris]|uniref:DUF8017 domain-containing protein n=1 Tax=Tessaracoccus aquimaris TaxID=1332264 RepID=A0A1Q2CMA6_9ACTN|nr:hypothetical protein [Tessaracoccus aquimaris]AQP47190.1 hypothetical protein BW730_06355 [Tessaracoccus aquimaris]